MKQNLSGILNIVRLLNQFRLVERSMRVNNAERFENDVEHSYSLAFLAWYIIADTKLDLDRDLVLKYALIHDLVEVYAGDTYFAADEEERGTKVQKEKDAALRLEKEIPEFAELHELIEQYEAREDKESRFVYALDKIQPMLNIYTDGGRTWKEKGVTIDMLVEHKKEKVAVSPEIEVYFNDLIAILREEEKVLFG